MLSGILQVEKENVVVFNKIESERRINKKDKPKKEKSLSAAKLTGSALMLFLMI